MMLSPAAVEMSGPLPKVNQPLYEPPPSSNPGLVSMFCADAPDGIARAAIAMITSRELFSIDMPPVCLGFLKPGKLDCPPSHWSPEH
jgi:hypothetical protein